MAGSKSEKKKNRITSSDNIFDDDKKEKKEEFKIPEEAKKIEKKDKRKEDDFGLEEDSLTDDEYSDKEDNDEDDEYEQQIKEIYQLFAEDPDIKKIKEKYPNKYSKKVYDEIQAHFEREKFNSIFVKIAASGTVLYERLTRLFGLKTDGLSTALLQNKSYMDELRKIFYKHNLVGKINHHASPEFMMGMMLMGATVEMHNINAKKETPAPIEPVEIPPPNPGNRVKEVNV